MELTTQQEVVALIEESDAALNKAASELAAKDAKIQEHAAVATKVAEHIPAAVQACIDFGRVQENQRDELTQILSSPVSAVQFIEKLAAHRNAEEFATLGQPHPGKNKSASANSSGQYERESDKIYKAFFGTR